MTGKEVVRKVQIPVKPPKQKSIYQKMQENHPKGFGKSIGMTTKSFESNTPAIQRILRSPKSK